jgi:hypothetical protein
MSKETLLKDYCKLILEMKDLKSMNPEFKSRMNNLAKAVKDLNSCDAVWFGDEYAKFSKRELEPLLRLKMEGKL